MAKKKMFKIMHGDLNVKLVKGAWCKKKLKNLVIALVVMCVVIGVRICFLECVRLICL